MEKRVTIESVTCPICGSSITIRIEGWISGIRRKKKIAIFPTEQGIFNGESEHLPKKCIYIEWWNRIPTPFKHPSPSSAAYMRSAYFFHQLELGTFWSDKAADDKWLLELGAIKDKQWKREAILQGIGRMSLLYKHGRWPFNKKGLPDRMEHLLYNPRTGRSWFFLVTHKEFGKRMKKEEVVSPSFSI